jgi:predicted aldo/keto reductase-like oxidoreductase
MRQVTLGRSGLQVSGVGFGGIPIMRLTEADAVKCIRAALDLGVTLIDTATAYADSQSKIGAAIHDRRKGLVLAGKSGSTTRDDMLRDIETAAGQMRTDTIDLYQLHGVNSEEQWQKLSASGGALEGLLEARDQGLVSHVGFTSHSLEVALRLVNEAVFETVQFPFNLVIREAMDELIPACREKGLGFIVMKPMCGGQYDDAELAFKFLNGYPDLVPIPGVERPEEIAEIVSVVAAGTVLEGKELERAESIAAALGRQFCRRCGYCEPCPQGVPVSACMLLESLEKRMLREVLIQGPIPMIAEKGPDCIECGECEEKCPYDLPIMAAVKKATARAAAMLRAGAV